MFIMPSFKKSLIVEQFQGNYLKAFSFYANPGMIIRRACCPVLLSTLADHEALWFSLFVVCIFEVTFFSQSSIKGGLL